MTTPTLSVSEFLAATNQTLEYAFGRIVVVGEVSSYNVNQDKFVFFDLKDSQGVVNCFAMKWTVSVPVEVGMQVAVAAVPKVTNKGKFSLTVQAIKPVGKGSIKRAFDLLRAKLEKEGLFDVARKRSLPVMPTRIAVVSSRDAAGYEDFITILNNRWGGVMVELAHVQVQGDGASGQIVRAIEHINAQSDLPEVLVVLRGGGSMEDLQAFNDEAVVRALAASRVPTITGVGHERDVTLADMVADVRAATPSNAAERIVPDKQQLLREMYACMRRVLDMSQRAVDMRIAEVFTGVERAFDTTYRHIGDLHEQVQRRRAVLEAYNPRVVLRQGYAIVRGEASVGKQIMIERNQDEITAEVTHVKRKT